MKPSPTESLATRRSVMFSPIVAMSSCRRSFTVVFAPGKCAASSASMVPSPMSAIFAASRAKAWNWSLRATKSVSEFTSRTVAVRPEDFDRDQPLGRDPARLLRRLGEALLAQPVDRALDVAGGLVERRLAVHHAGAGLVAQLLHHRRRDVRHGCSFRSHGEARRSGERRAVGGFRRRAVPGRRRTQLRRRR